MTDNDRSAELSLPLLRAGDRAEIARMVDQHSTKIYRLALKMLGNQQDAEDVLQNTFMKAIQALPNFEGRSSIATWLYRVAVNESLMLIRQRKPAFNLTTNAPEEAGDFDALALTNFTDWCCLPESELVSAESVSYLEKAIQSLSEKLRLVFILRDVEKLSIRETSKALEISESAVKTRLLRARLQLRELLSEYYESRLPAET